MNMEDYSFQSEISFVVPPDNTIHVVVSQRLDNGFRATCHVEGSKHIYVSLRKSGHHVAGSTMGAYKSMKAALEVARWRWENLTNGEDRGALGSESVLTPS